MASQHAGLLLSLGLVACVVARGRPQLASACCRAWRVRIITSIVIAEALSAAHCRRVDRVSSTLQLPPSGHRGRDHRAARHYCACGWLRCLLGKEKAAAEAFDQRHVIPHYGVVSGNV